MHEQLPRERITGTGLPEGPVIFRLKEAIIGAMLYRIVPCLLIAISVIAQTNEETARALLNRGVAAFKAARYSQATAEFDAAAKLAPGDSTIKLYLGTVYMVQWIPGADTPENSDFAARAEAEFRAVLAIDSNNKVAVASLASLEFNKARAVQSGQPERARILDEAGSWYRRLLQIDPRDKTALYSLGVIEWERFYPELMNARAKLGMRPEDPGPLPDGNIRRDLQNRFGASVEEAMTNLNNAIAIDPDYDDAMAYLNLLHRERADISDSVDAYQRDIAKADAQVTRALDARRRKAEQSPAGGGAQSPEPTRAGAAYGGGSAQSPERIRVGANIQAQNLLQKPEPIYPTLAQQARVHGTVRFSITIGKDGWVQNVQLVSGHPFLVPAATEAVKRYVYKTTLLNGQPVEVITAVEVNFILPN